MIYITGDTHADFGRFSNRTMKRQGMELTEQDYVIVCGDFGLCWEKGKTFDYNCKFFAEKKYTILWVEGNHENYDMIAEYPLEEWNGGKVRHIVRDKVILLERGQVFTIEGKTFFTFGGAASHDITDGILEPDDPDLYEKRKKLDREWGLYRINHISWWKEELPNEEEMQEGRNNLQQYGYKVDYVITHCASTGIQNQLDKGPGQLFQPDILTDYLQELEEKLEYSHWYFGHYHMDLDVDEKHTVLFDRIVPLDNNVEKETDKDIRVNRAVEQVIATMEISGMYVNETFKQELIKVAKGEKTSEELRQEIIKRYTDK